MRLIDDDNAELAKPEMWDKKRKFMTFLEEIALLVRSEQIDREVAFYMFGYYATCVKKGLNEGGNFTIGIDTSPEHWGLLFGFTADSEAYAQKNPSGPSLAISL